MEVRFMIKYIKNYINNDITFDKKTKLAIICLIIVISGIFGWLYEFIFYFFNSGMKTFYFRGANFLPWINIYAIGAVMIFLLTYKKRKHPIYIFLISIIASGILEYIGGYYMEYFNDVRCWNYDEEILNFGNINGYVCLRSVLIFGIMSLLLMYLVVPFIFYLETKLNKKTFLIICYSLCFIFLADELYNLIFANAFSLPRASSIYKKIGLKYLYF